ncbi:hypothetical protein ACFSSC_07655 [Corynebacterium mendelii]|uniref:Uncharacterized protein n=1 Tax=Corynebacterium mendelii TaxID=2765362 RepID=A0A939E330_9CORY|nr:hypothetical protein [Corynebacterium mendelii]MBN9644791.1 hypothetical protein [Corynebacterium mendelii]
MASPQRPSPVPDYGPPLVNLKIWLAVTACAAGTAILVAGMFGWHASGVDWPGFVVAAPLGMSFLLVRLIQVAVAGDRAIIRDDPTKAASAAGLALVFTVLVATGIFREAILVVCAGLFVGGSALLCAWSMGVRTVLDPRISASGPARVVRGSRKNTGGSSRGSGLRGGATNSTRRNRTRRR